MRNKKAGLPDGIFLVVGFFALAVIFLFSYVMFSKINTEMQGSGIISQQGKDMASSIMTRYPTLFDRAFLFSIIGLGIGVIAGAWFIPSHPALFWISIPILAFIIWLGGLYANIFHEIRTHALITTYAVDFPVTLFIFDHFVLIITIYILLLATALYAKAKVQA